MKIITWNCNMAFRKKYHDIINEAPDLLIVIECEQKSKLEDALSETNYKQIIWFGDNIHKGIAIISFVDFKIKLFSNYSTEYRYVIPLHLSGKIDFDLYVIWAMPNLTNRKRGYVGQIWAAINYYSDRLSKQENSILIGDFNSNAFWDKERKKGNHSDVVNFLAAKGIVSLYHSLNDEAHGGEKQATQYMYRDQTKPYHLDYCFLSKHLVQKQTELSVGKFDPWIKQSDHMPLIIDKIFAN